jgi:hypothetical protein
MMGMTAFKKSSFLVIVNQGGAFNGASVENDSFSPFPSFSLIKCMCAYYTRSNILYVLGNIYIYIIPIIQSSESPGMIDDDVNDDFEIISSFTSFPVISIILGV